MPFTSYFLATKYSRDKAVNNCRGENGRHLRVHKSHKRDNKLIYRIFVPNKDFK